MFSDALNITLSNSADMLTEAADSDNRMKSGQQCHFRSSEK
jgi:hypothetical protein